MLAPCESPFGLNAAKRAGKFVVAGANMPAKLGQIEIMRILRIGMQSNADSSGEKGIKWAEPARRTSLRKRATTNRRSRSRAPVEDDDYEDGDIATPKRDRHGNDDEPL